MKTKPMFSLKKRHRIMIDTESGLKMAVMRPCDPTMARVKIEMGRLAIKHWSKDDEFFQRIVEDTGDHTFVGWLAADTPRPTLVDENGFEIGELQAGDSFVTIDEEKLKNIS